MAWKPTVPTASTARNAACAYTKRRHSKPSRMRRMLGGFDGTGLVGRMPLLDAREGRREPRYPTHWAAEDAASRRARSPGGIASVFSNPTTVDVPAVEREFGRLTNDYGLTPFGAWRGSSFTPTSESV